jgi:hypothetical protein
MTTFRDWLERVFTQGESVQDAPPAFPDRTEEIEEPLRREFGLDSLDVAGPEIAFDAAVAREAAMVLARACWLLVRDPEDRERLTLTLKPADSPAAHLSADVSLRFLPSVHRRAKLREPTGELVRQLEEILRAWPLSGVLADLDGSPTTDPEFGGHPGLQMLYAERLAVTGRAGWVPVSAAAREWAERIHHELGKPLPTLPPPTPTEERHV